jgi:hypothetical protein
MRPSPRRLAATLAPALLVAAALAGCTPVVNLEPAADAGDPQCAEIITRLDLIPDMEGLELRETNAQATAAWSQPGSTESAVLLRCGIEPPGPTAEFTCVTIDGVDWLQDPSEDPVYRFITYGREPATEVIVDTEQMVSGTNVLNNLATTIDFEAPERECLDAQDVFEGATPDEDGTLVNPDATPAPPEDEIEDGAE